MSARGRSRLRPRRGAALVMALAALGLLIALAVALHAVALRERRSARRASLTRAAADAADAALARWQVRLALGQPDEVLAAVAGEGAGEEPVPGTTQLLEGARDDAGGAGEGVAADGTVPARVHVTLVTLGGGVRLLVSDATANAAGLRARRRVSLLLVPDTLPRAAEDSAVGTRARLVAAPERAWSELP